MDSSPNWQQRRHFEDNPHPPQISPKRCRAQAMPASFPTRPPSALGPGTPSPTAAGSPQAWAVAPPSRLRHQSTRFYLRVIDAVRSERMVGLMPQWGTVLGGVVVGLRHVYDCFIVQGYCIPIEGPVSAVYLVCKAKTQCARGGSTSSAVWKQTFKYMQLKLFQATYFFLK